MNKFILFSIIVVLIGLMTFVGLVLYVNSGDKDISVTSEDETAIINSNINSASITFNNISLVDSTQYNQGTNTCTALRNNMNITIYPCSTQDIDGRDIEQYVNFKWQGVATQNVSWVFVYEGAPIKQGKIEVLRNVNYQSEENGYQWVNNYLVDRVVGSTNLGSPQGFCDLGSVSNNTQMYIVNRSQVANATIISRTYCFTNVSVVNATAFRISGNINALVTRTRQRPEWVDYSGSIVYMGFGLLNDSRSYYRTGNVEFSPQEEIKTRWTYTSENSAKTGKWHILGYNTNTGLVGALAADQYIYMDPWWNTTWTYRRIFNVTETDGLTHTNEPVLLIFNTTQLITDGKMQASCKDIRVTNSSDVEVSGYNITSCNSSSTRVYFKYTQSANINETFYLYYGNALAPSGASYDPNYSLVKASSTIIELQLNADTYWYPTPSSNGWDGLTPDLFDSDGVTPITYVNTTYNNDYYKLQGVCGGHFVETGSNLTSNGALKKNWIHRQGAGLGRYNCSQAFFQLEYINFTLNGHPDSSTYIYFASDPANWDPSTYITPVLVLDTSAVGAEEATTPSFPLSLAVTLISPANNTVGNTTSVWFSANSTVTNGNLTNATLFIWGGGLFNNFTVVTNAFNSTNLSRSGFIDGMYLWNYQFCSTNQTAVICAFAASNRTFNFTSPPYQSNLNYTGNNHKVFFFKLNENSGTTAFNEIIGGSNGVYNATPTWETSSWTGFGNAARHTSARILNTQFLGNTSLQSNFSLEFRLNSTEVNGRNIITWGNASLSGFGIGYDGSGTGTLSWAITNCTQINLIGPGTLNNSNYHMVITRNDSSWNLYQNGVSVYKRECSTIGFNGANIIFGVDPSLAFVRPYLGQVDQLLLWDYTLNATDIAALYVATNDGSANSISLVSPANQSMLSTLPLIFNVTTTTANNVNNTNLTINVWYSNGTLFNSTLVPVTGSGVTSTTVPMYNFTTNTYIWGAYACFTNGCLNSASNYSFIFNNLYTITVNSLTYNAFTYSLANERFILNVTLSVGLTNPYAIFTYNNTNYTVTPDSDGINYIFNTSIVVPLVISQTNKNFFFTVFAYNDTTLNGYQTGTYIQTINPVSLDDCSTNTILLLNYSLYDEESLQFIVPNVNNTNVTIEVDARLEPSLNYGQYINASVKKTNTNPVLICITNGVLNQSTYYLTTQARYSTTNRVTEQHNLQNVTTTNSTIPYNIRLYDLLSADSQEFKITFKDDSLLVAPNVLVDISRKYIGEGIFRSVEVPITDAFGVTYGHFDLDNIPYTLTFTKYGKVLAVFNNFLPVCQNPAITTCEINLNQLISSASANDLFIYGDASFSPFTFNQSTRTGSIVFTSIDGTSRLFSINTTMFDAYGNTTVCSQALVSSSGTLSCTIPANIRNGTFLTDIYIDGQRVLSNLFYIKQDSKSLYGNYRGILVFLLVVSCALMLLSEPIALVLGGAFGLLMAIFLNISEGGSIFGIASTFIWLVVVIGIVGWYTSKR